MTTRNDVNVDFNPSPRIAEVEAPSTNLTMQDTVDTLRIREEGFTEGLSHPKLLSASGKEDLGGGVFVGVTVTLQDILISFEARTIPAETGTVTTGSGAPVSGEITFVDTTADFVTAGIQRGSMVINFSDHSIADVVRVDNLNTLTTRTLVNGITNTYQVGDVYHVFNVIQCDLDGGNLVAIDDLGSPISAVLPTAFTQIIRTSSSSATLKEQVDIQFSSFNGGVTVDVVNGVAGTTFPIGTSRAPVNNLTDAKTILITRGFGVFFIVADITVSNGVFPYHFIGQGPNRSLITVLSSADVTDSEFTQCELSGDVSGTKLITDCHILSINNFGGDMKRCLLLSGTISLGGSVISTFIDCWDGTAGLTQPVIDLGGSGQELVVRNYPGGLEIRNKTGSEEISITGNGIRIFINDTVTNGEIILRGTGKWDNADVYVGGATVVNELISIEGVISALNATLYDGKSFEDLQAILLSMAEGRIRQTSENSGVFEFYAQNNTTILYTLTKTPLERTRAP